MKEVTERQVEVRRPHTPVGERTSDKLSDGTRGAREGEEEDSGDDGAADEGEEDSLGLADREGVTGGEAFIFSSNS
jgi:hypothetical protein